MIVIRENKIFSLVIFYKFKFNILKNGKEFNYNQINKPADDLLQDHPPENKL